MGGDDAVEVARVARASPSVSFVLVLGRCRWNVSIAAVRCGSGRAAQRPDPVHHVSRVSRAEASAAVKVLHPKPMHRPRPGRCLASVTCSASTFARAAAGHARGEARDATSSPASSKRPMSGVVGSRGPATKRVQPALSTRVRHPTA